MKLSVKQRVMLFNMLPVEGSFATLRTVRQLRRDLSLTEAEVKEINFRDDPENPGRVVWDRETADQPDIDVTEQGRALVADRLKELDAAGKLRDEHYEVYELFVADHD